jgi:ribonuclease HI
MQKYQTEIHWVKAHANSKENNLVDQIARKQANNID